MIRKTSFKESLVEKLPAFTVFGVILGPLLGAIFIPKVTSYFIIIFNIYFLYKSISYFVLLVLSVIQIRNTENIDWMLKIKDLKFPSNGIERLERELFDITTSKYVHEKERLNRNKLIPSFLDGVVFRLEQRKMERYIKKEIEKLKVIEKQGLFFDPSKSHHVILIPHWKEPYEVLEDTVKAISKSTFPTKQISIVMGAESRDPEGIEKSYKLKKEYGHIFEQFWVSSHELQEDDAIGKSSNMAWAGKMVVKEIKKLGWDLKYTTMTSCDADSILDSQHFAKLSYEYSLRKDAFYKFYTGAIVFYSNIWKLKFYARIRNSIASLHNISAQLRPDKLVPFSTYTTSFWLIEKIGYWTPWITPEDFHIFFKSLMKYPAKVTTVPLFLKTLSDAAEGDTHIETLKNNYFQQRRWAWGITIDGWMISKLIALILEGKMTIRAMYIALHVFFDHIMLVVVSIIVIIGGNIPYLLNPDFATTVLGVRLPGFSSMIIQTTVWFLVGMIITDYYFVKPKSERKGVLKAVLSMLEWVLLPYVNFLLVFLPGLEANTRLIFGKRLEYYLTKKK